MEVSSPFKCHFCERCDGRGCVAELPGMGGVFENANFMQNCSAWDRLAERAGFTGSNGPVAGGSCGGFGLGEWAESALAEAPLPRIRLAPVTGAIQNVGYADERLFYADLIRASARAGVGLAIGDGYPDEKLKYGIEALESIFAETGRTAAVFIKPYPNERIEERMDWADHVAEILGVDIDSYAILTMRNLVNLQRKTAGDLIALKRRARRPFAIKGVFKAEDIALVREVKPDIVVVSNHGGRVETRRGSTADFLDVYGKELARHCGELWVDGGLRKRRDLAMAARLGASTVLVGRPFITGLLRDAENGVASTLARLVAPDPAVDGPVSADGRADAATGSDCANYGYVTGADCATEADQAPLSWATPAACNQ